MNKFSANTDLVTGASYTTTVTLPKTVTGAGLLSQEISQPLVWARTSCYQLVFPPVEAGMCIANPRANYHLLEKPDCPSFTQEVWFRTSSAGVVRAYSNVPGTATKNSVVRLDAGTSGYLVFSIRADDAIGAVAKTVVADKIVTDNQWHHAVTTIVTATTVKNPVSTVAETASSKGRWR